MQAEKPTCNQDFNSFLLVKKLTASRISIPDRFNQNIKVRTTKIVNMNNFKNALKSVNKIGLFAIALVAFAAMAFTPAKKNSVAQKYGYDQVNNQWVLIEGKTMDNSSNPAPGTYRCDASPETCSGLFSTPPTSGSSIPDSGSEVDGDFSLN